MATDIGNLDSCHIWEYHYIREMHPVPWDSEQVISSFGQIGVSRWLGSGIQEKGREIQATGNRNRLQRDLRAGNKQGNIQVYLVLNIKEHVVGVGGSKGVVLTIGSMKKSS